MTSRSSSQTRRGIANRQNQTSGNQTNVRGLAPSSPSEVIPMLKGLKKHKNKITPGKTKTNRLVEYVWENF